MTDALSIMMLTPGIAAMGIVLGLFYKGIDRKLAARMQARIGPPVTQPFRDVRKLMMKENVMPKDAVAWIFNLMPVIALTASLALLLYVPLLGLPPLMEGQGDLILVLYLLLLPSLALVIGGFSSASPYATVGAQREMITMVSYEFPLALSIVAVAWLTSALSPGLPAFSLLAISGTPVWALAGPAGMLGMGLLFIVMLFVATGELGAIPFDAAEAETEICGGLFAEYSGRNLALFYIASAVKMVAIGSLIIALFIPFGISGALGLSGLQATAADAGFYLLKLFLVLFASSTFMRVAFARFRITQVVKVYWGYTTIIAFAGLLLVGVDILLRMVA